eukprot:327806-Alexandrium_andersonii.AAC.1
MIINRRASFDQGLGSRIRNPNNGLAPAATLLLRLAAAAARLAAVLRLLAAAAARLADLHGLPHLFRHVAIRSNTGPGLRIQPGRS